VVEFGVIVGEIPIVTSQLGNLLSLIVYNIFFSERSLDSFG